MTTAPPDDPVLGLLAPLGRPIAMPEEDPLGFPGYAARLAALREDGADESVEVGIATIDGLEVVAARARFEVLGGSMGRAHGERIVGAMTLARERGLPFVARTASGGARMQEGMLALVQLVRTAEAVRRMREVGLPTITVLSHPTTGGVLASYGALGDVLLAEEGATIGFAGPRVVEATTGIAVGADSHSASSALATGLVDEVVPRAALRGALAEWLGLLHPTRRDGPLPRLERDRRATVRLAAEDAWRRARRSDRPSVRDLLSSAFDAHRELRGDRAGADDAVAVAAVARLGQRSLVVVGFDRRAIGRGGRPGAPEAAGFRKLQRALALATRWGLPVVALIDTAGADPAPDSERSGLAAAIAETFVAMLSVPAPTLAVVTGEGGSGGALAIGATDRLVLQDDAVFEVIAPEGAATILHRDPARAPEVVAALEPTAHRLVELGIADGVLPGPTTTDPLSATAALTAELANALAELEADPDRLARRRARYGPAPALGTATGATSGAAPGTEAGR